MNYNELLKTSIWYEKIPEEIIIPDFNDDYHHLQYNILNKRNPMFCKWIIDNFPKELKWMEKLYWFINGLNQKPICSVCMKNFCIFKNFYVGYIETCGISCSSKKSRTKANTTYKKNNNITDPNIKCSLNDPKIRKKIKETCNKNYGGNSTMCRNDIKQKNTQSQRQNNIKKFEFLLGYTKTGNWICKCPHPDKFINEDCNNCPRYFITIPSIHQDRIKLNIETCTALLPYKPRISNNELEDRAIVKNLGLKAEYNKTKYIKPYELDIYIESLKLAIEENGLVYHNINSLRRIIPKNYHMIKQKLCRSKGIELISFWEHWNTNDKYEFLKAKIENKSLYYWKKLWYPDLKDNEWPLDLGWPPGGQKILKIIEHQCFYKDPHVKKEKLYECYDSGVAILV